MIRGLILKKKKYEKEQEEVEAQARLDAKREYKDSLTREEAQELRTEVYTVREHGEEGTKTWLYLRPDDCMVLGKYVPPKPFTEASRKEKREKFYRKWCLKELKKLQALEA